MDEAESVEDVQGNTEATSTPEETKEVKDDAQGSTEADSGKKEGDAEEENTGTLLGKPEDKKEDSSDEDGKGEKDDGQKPTEYKPFTAPEGKVLDGELSAKFSSAALGMGLSQEQAQAVVDMGFEVMEKATNDIQLAQKKVWDDLNRDWVKEIKEDADFGGKNLDATLNHARKALANFGGESLQAYLDDSGLGNHPEVLKFLARVNMATGEDKSEVGGKAKLSPEEALYPTMFNR